MTRCRFLDPQKKMMTKKECLSRNLTEQLIEYKKVQEIAKNTIEYIKAVIEPNMSLPHLRNLCEDKMLSLGADSFWYYDVGAFVFSGNETTLSVSGKEYITSNRLIQKNDIITIDLSPQSNDVWGDYARTLILENGDIVDNIEKISNPEWKNGLLMENDLHNELIRFAKPNTTFEELFHHMNEYIVSKGYINLDFLGNLGHSIVKNKKDRIFIENGSKTKLCDVKFFTFEPHISIRSSVYGYKKENIYYFNGEALTEL